MNGRARLRRHASLQRSRRGALSCHRNRARSGSTVARLLSGGGAIAAAFAITGREAAAADADIVVIGAGAAGIAAARSLRDAGRKPIVLEARNRIGGRAFTDTSLGPNYDAGAMFIHWAERAPGWVQIARDLDIKTAARSMGRRLSPLAEGRPMAEEIAAADATPSARSTGGSKRSISARATCRSRNCWAISGRTARPSPLGLLLSIGEDRAVSRRATISASGQATTSSCPPATATSLPAPAPASTSARTSRSRPSAGAAPASAITTRSGEIRAQGCILTVPIGVLKAGGIRFTPELPAATRDALAGMRYGRSDQDRLARRGRPLRHRAPARASSKLPHPSG